MKPHAKHRDEQEGEQNSRKGQHGIDKPLDDEIDLSAKIGGDNTDRNTHENADRDDDESDEKGDACAVDDPAEDASAQLIPSQGIVPGGGGELIDQAMFVGIMRCKKRSKEGREKEDHHDNQSHHGRYPFGETPEHIPEGPPLPFL